MSDTLITKSQYDSPAAGASKKVASAAIREVAEQIKFTGDVDVVISQTEPEDDNVYWIYFEYVEE